MNNLAAEKTSADNFDANSYSTLGKEFYTRNALSVAKDLLGKILVRKNGASLLAGRIVEVEAYRGSDDQSSHSFGGKTERNSVMFESGGFLYVYFIYGVHYCANVVTGKENEGDAVLIRAIEPLAGIDKMFENRFPGKEKTEKSLINLANGPAKLCQAFGISRQDNGADLTGGEIFMAKEKKRRKFEIARTTRIGISKSKELEWRFFIKDNPFVSAK